MQELRERERDSRSVANGSRRKYFNRRASATKIESKSLTDDEAVTKRLKREATIAANEEEILKTDTERPKMEQAHKFYANIRTTRSPESIHASRTVEINKWREKGVVER